MSDDNTIQIAMKRNIAWCYSYGSQDLRKIADILDALEDGQLYSGGNATGEFDWYYDDDLCGHFKFDAGNSEDWHYKPAVKTYTALDKEMSDDEQRSPAKDT